MASRRLESRSSVIAMLQTCAGRMAYGQCEAAPNVLARDPSGRVYIWPFFSPLHIKKSFCRRQRLIVILERL